MGGEGRGFNGGEGREGKIFQLNICLVQMMEGEGGGERGGILNIYY